MEQTSHLSLPFILPSQAQKHVTHNEALRLLDAIVQLAVKGRNSGSAAQDPAGGDRHIVGANASGDWAGHEHDVALFDGAGWMFLPPAQGWIAFVEDEDDFVTFRDGAWEPLEKGTNPVALLGVNTLADQTNKLAVKSDVVLHSHDDVTPGTGDARDLVFGQLLLLARAGHQSAHLACVDEQHFALPFAVPVAVPVLGDEPQTDRDAGVIEQPVRHRDNAVHQVRLDQPFAYLALAARLRRQRPVGEDEPGGPPGRQVVDEVLHPSEVGVALRRGAVLPAGVVGELGVPPVRHVEWGFCRPFRRVALARGFRGGLRANPSSFGRRLRISWLSRPAS